MMSWIRMCFLIIVVNFGLTCTNAYTNEETDSVYKIPLSNQMEGAIKIVKNLFSIRELANVVQCVYYFDNPDANYPNKEAGEEIIKLVDEIFVELIKVGSLE